MKKVDGRDVIRGIITAVVCWEVADIAVNYRVWSRLPGFPIGAAQGIVVLSILLLPIMWLPSLRRKVLLNAALFLAMFTVVAAAEWEVFGNKPISYGFGVLWLTIVIAFFFDFRQKRRREWALKAAEQELTALEIARKDAEGSSRIL